MLFSGFGHVAISGDTKPVPHQRAGLAAGGDQCCSAAGLIEQVTDVAEILDALLPDFITGGGFG